MVATAAASDASFQRRPAAKGCHAPPPPPEAPPLPCPRCESTNTKFCYYNNYNFSQPRHFCKSCRRYWTQGGTLRDIPVGGGSRKNSAKRFRTSAAASSTSSFHHSPAAGGSLAPFSGEVQYHHVFGDGGGGSFTSLLNGGGGGGGISGLLGVGGFGLEEVGFGFQSNAWPFGVTDTWQVGDGAFALPELTISSTTTDFMK